MLAPALGQLLLRHRPRLEHQSAIGGRSIEATVSIHRYVENIVFSSIDILRVPYLSIDMLRVLYSYQSIVEATVSINRFSDDTNRH